MPDRDPVCGPCGCGSRDDLPRLVMPVHVPRSVYRAVRCEVLHHARRGLVPKQVAHRVGRSCARVNEILREEGIKWRPLERIPDEEIIARVRRGERHQQIADAYGVDRTTVSNRIRRMRMRRGLIL